MNRLQKIIIVLAAILACMIGMCAYLLTPPARYSRNMNLGNRYLLAMDYEKAAQAFTAAITIEPKKAEAYIGRGDAYAGLKEPEKAQADYIEAVQLDPGVQEAVQKKIDALEMTQDGGTADSTAETVPQTPTPTPTDEAAPGALTVLNPVITDTFWEGNDGSQRTVSFVSLSDSDKQLCPALGQGLDSYFAQEETQMESENQRVDSVPPLPENETPPPYDQQKATIARADTKILSIVYAIEGYGGGVHGWHMTHGLNFDSQTGKILTTADIILNTQTASQILAQKLITEVGADAFYNSGATLQSDIESNLKPDGGITWSADQNGYTFYFDIYLFGAYYAGGHETRVNFSEYPDVFSTAWQN